MQVNASKLLENLIAIAAFDAEKRNHTTYLIDRLFLVMLGQDNSHAMKMLRSRLKEWELYQIRLRIEREIRKITQPQIEQNRESFYRELIVGVAETAGIWAALDSDSVAGKSLKANTGHLLLYILNSPESIAGRILGMYNIIAGEIGRELSRLPSEELYISEIRIIRRQKPRPEDDDWEPSDDDPQGPETDSPQEPHASRNQHPTRQKGLDKFGIDLTRAASEGRLDPVIGRAREIERMVQILGRRKKNNPVLVGEAGVGKTAIVEGLAIKIAAGEVPPSLAGKRLFMLDIASLVAGTKFRGEFEERLKTLMDELVKHRDTIVFIDEIHTIVGAGSSQGSLDTANILKPALARGEIQCVGATTLDEFRENIEKDAALERRFQKIIIEPTSRDETLEILRQIKGQYEHHHVVTYTDDALQACVDLTGRYVTDRNFPDKAIDALDEAGSRGHQNGTSEITAAHIDEVIGTMTGIPVEKVSQGEKSRLSRLAEHLGEFVVGQDEAVSKVSRSLIRSRSGLKDPGKPIGVFMFVGPTGVGKTLLAKELSKWMFDRPDALIRIDMSEYAEKHNVSRLIGSPPGYVGYGEGGQLTEAVRRQPYSVVLFDEVEKAHPDIFNVMLQMFDDGHLTDGLGRKVDFRNTIIIMTSNVGSRSISTRAPMVGYNTSSTEEREAAGREAKYRAALGQNFAPEFINRIDDIVVFNVLGDEDIARVVDLELASLISRGAALGFDLQVSPEAKEQLAVAGYDPEYGVRSLKRAILEYIEEPMAQHIVDGAIIPGQQLTVTCTDGEFRLKVTSQD